MGWFIQHGLAGAHMIRVSALGWRDRHPDGIYDPQVNKYRNAFSNSNVRVAAELTALAKGRNLPAPPRVICRTLPRVQPPRRWGAPFSAGVDSLRRFDCRPLRTNCSMGGKLNLSHSFRSARRRATHRPVRATARGRPT